MSGLPGSTDQVQRSRSGREFQAGEASTLPAWSATGAAPGAAPAAAVWEPLAGHAGDGPYLALLALASRPDRRGVVPGRPGYKVALLRGSAAHWPALCWINQAPSQTYDMERYVYLCMRIRKNRKKCSSIFSSREDSVGGLPCKPRRRRYAPPVCYGVHPDHRLLHG